MAGNAAPSIEQKRWEGIAIVSNQAGSPGLALGVNYILGADDIIEFRVGLHTHGWSSFQKEGSKGVGIQGMAEMRFLLGPILYFGPAIGFGAAVTNHGGGSFNSLRGRFGFQIIEQSLTLAAVGGLELFNHGKMIEKTGSFGLELGLRF